MKQNIRRKWNIMLTGCSFAPKFAISSTLGKVIGKCCNFSSGLYSFLVFLSVQIFLPDPAVTKHILCLGLA